MKKVLFLMNSLSTGGAEKVLVNIINNLSPNEFDVTLLTIFDNTSESNQLSPSVKRVSVIKNKNQYIQGIAYKYFSKLLSPKKLYHKIVKDSYDVEIAFLEGLPTKIIAGSSNIASKKIAWIHTDINEFRDSDYCYKNDKMQKLCYSKFNRIVCVSNGVKNSFIKRFGDSKSLLVIYNPIDENEVIYKSKLITKSPYSKPGFHFVSVGRLNKQKAFDRLIEACRILRDKDIDFELCIVGDGVERINLETLIEKYNLTQIVHLYGYSSNPYQIIQMADAMVISSHVEGFPLVAVEGLILGKPIVSTEVTGPREILEEGKWGLLVSPDEKSLADGMQKMMDDRSFRYYKELAMIRGSQFKMNAVINEITEVLKK